jgi:hypothetical protein
MTQYSWRLDLIHFLQTNMREKECDVIKLSACQTWNHIIIHRLTHKRYWNKTLLGIVTGDSIEDIHRDSHLIEAPADASTSQRDFWTFAGNTAPLQPCYLHCTKVYSMCAKQGWICEQVSFEQLSYNWDQQNIPNCKQSFKICFCPFVMNLSPRC